MGQKEEVDERVKIFSPLQVNNDLIQHAKKIICLCIACQLKEVEKLPIK